MTKKNAFVDHLIWFLRSLGRVIIAHFLVFGLFMAPMFLKGEISLSRIPTAFVIMMIVSIISCTVADFMAGLKKRDERWKARLERWRAESEKAYQRRCCRCACCRSCNQHRDMPSRTCNKQ